VPEDASPQSEPIESSAPEQTPQQVS
jgi:hypothetical protein